MNNANPEIVERLRQLMADEGMTSTSDYGTLTPEYLYRLLDGEVPVEEIRKAMAEVLEKGQPK